jgi:hypothetical protein
MWKFFFIPNGKSKGKVVPVLNKVPHHKQRHVLYLIKHHTTKTHRGMQIQLSTFLTLALDRGE